MKKKRAETENKLTRVVAIAVVSVIMVIVIIAAFTINFNKIYGLLLEKDMEQVRFTSSFVTKLISTEIENLQAALDSSQRVFIQTGNNQEETAAKYLDDISRKFGFKKVGLSDLAGNSIDNTGKRERLYNDKMFDSIKNGKKYISNVLNLSDIMLIAVPFYKDNQVAGTIWGYYSISSISDKIELNDKSHRYFQIIDDTGLYISDSGNINSFAEDRNIWKELTRYKISDGITVDQIKKTVEKGQGGEFHFSYKGKGRYVTYEPLGINNWYVFSVLVEEYLGDYATKIETIFFGMLWGILIGLFLLVGLIGRYIFTDLREVKKHNEELSLKNSLLFMVVKHTNDIPFEVDFQNNTLTVYSNTNSEQPLVRKIEYYAPENMLSHGWITAEEYPDYRDSFKKLIRGEKIQPVVFKMKINGKWDYNKLHIKIVNQNRMIGFLEDYNEQMLQEQKIKEIRIKSQTDSLTGLYNREHFTIECNKYIKEEANNPNGKISALFLLDLDHFKSANDTLGHMTGDQILRECGNKMKAIIRETDLAGRLGGDEFVLFIRNAKDMQSLRICAEKVNRVLKQSYGTGTNSVTISASIGIAVWTTEKSFEDLYKMADQALYKAKDKGRDRYHIVLKDKDGSILQIE